MSVMNTDTSEAGLLAETLTVTITHLRTCDVPAVLLAGWHSAVIFGHGDRAVSYLELRTNEVKFIDATGTFSPVNTIFGKRKSTDSVRPTLLKLQFDPNYSHRV